MYKIFLSAFAVLLVVSCGSNNESQTQKNANPEVNVGYDTLSLGKETFQEKCAVCHGSDGRLGASGAKILPDTKMNLEEVKTQVMNGKKAMPAFKQVLTEDQILAVSKYVLTLKETEKK